MDANIHRLACGSSVNGDEIPTIPSSTFTGVLSNAQRPSLSASGSLQIFSFLLSGERHGCKPFKSQLFPFGKVIRAIKKSGESAFEESRLQSHMLLGFFNLPKESNASQFSKKFIR
jgi:hypothetical protein